MDILFNPTLIEVDKTQHMLKTFCGVLVFQYFHMEIRNCYKILILVYVS